MTDTSRSPYIVSASVRGIGVAVITSTSGMQSLAAERRPLQDAEPMLLVDHDQAELLEAHVASRRARACRRRGAPRRLSISASCSRRARRRDAPVSDATRNRDGCEQPRDVQEVLIGQNLGRRHERDLQTVLHRDERRQQRDDRLARADVALQQPVHRLRLLQVVDDLPERRAAAPPSA